MEARYSPVYVLRNYVWDVLKANTEMDESDYNGLIPIVPVAEQPELTQFSQPYIVYGYMLAGTGSLPAIKRGSMSFVVYSQNFGALVKVTNIIEHALGRMDESARDVNNYKKELSQYTGIRFGEIHTALVEGPTDQTETGEGGRQVAIVNVSFTYFIEHDIETVVLPA